MKTIAAAALGGAILLAACEPKALALPDQPIDRAATCGVIAAAEARAATPDITQPLPFAAQGHILHYALLAGAEGEEFSAETASAVSKRMSELQEGITSGKWEALAPACRAAYPDAEKTEAGLPADRLDAGLGCDELGDFMTSAMGGQEEDYGEVLSGYRDMARTLDRTLGPGLRSRVGSGLPAQQKARREAMAEIVRLGSPAAVMEACVKRFA